MFHMFTLYELQKLVGFMTKASNLTIDKAFTQKQLTRRFYFAQDCAMLIP